MSYRCIFFILFAFYSLSLSGQTVQREMIVNEDYLNLPVSQSSDRADMVLTFQDGTERSFTIRLSEETPDYWVFVDLKDFQNQNLTIQYPAERAGLGMIYQDSEIVGADSLYQEKARPQFHFTTQRGWNNDPNGLVYSDGIYHLFYQHNPYEIYWENMHWGHATSTDLIHWEEQGDKLFPDELGTMYSGSAIVDKNNAGGFQIGDESVLVAFYTAHVPGKEVQCLAYSNDNGKSWTKYNGNPIIDSKEKWDSGNTRDPKVFWHEPTSRWVMVLFEKDGHSIYTSTNLKEWTYRSHTSGFWECPELMELPVDGDMSHKKWVMYGASGTYMIGDFDGEKFHIESGKHQYYSGKMYAAQTYSNTPGYPNPIIQIGWGQITHPGMPFNQMMLFPTELSLRTTRNGIRLFSRPIGGLKTLYEKSWQWTNLDVQQANKKLEEISGDLFNVKMKVKMIEGIAFDFLLDGNSIATYSFNHNTLNKAFYPGAQIDHRIIELDILIDRTSIELFADGGKFTVIQQREPARNNEGLQFSKRGNKVKIHNLEVHRMKSIW